MTNTGYEIHRRHIMKQAWQMARQGCRIYGGAVRQYLSEALKIMWSRVKTEPIYQDLRNVIAETRARKAGLGAPLPRLTRRVRVFGGAYL